MEEEKCELCEGTGLVPDYEFEEGRWIVADTQPCPHVLQDEDDRQANEEENA